MSVEYYVLAVMACALMIGMSAGPISDSRVAQTAAIPVSGESYDTVAGRSAAGVMETLPR